MPLRQTADLYPLESYIYEAGVAMLLDSRSGRFASEMQGSKHDGHTGPVPDCSPRSAGPLRSIVGVGIGIGKKA